MVGCQQPGAVHRRPRSQRSPACGGPPDLLPVRLPQVCIATPAGLFAYFGENFNYSGLVKVADSKPAFVRQDRRSAGRIDQAATIPAGPLNLVGVPPQIAQLGPRPRAKSGGRSTSPAICRSALFPGPKQPTLRGTRTVQRKMFRGIPNRCLQGLACSSRRFPHGAM